MNQKIVQRALKKIAKKEGISVAEVKHEIEVAIAFGKSNPDNRIQQRWKEVLSKGETPTPEEVILQLAKKVKS
ncbi:hypothetical protein LJC58_01555 [Lachnospiraceae bacterium OttesenSCG-928-D06]|nr:hypothetical protein [Lachnospiraceae bacterium OttesenSCG-928-D06]